MPKEKKEERRREKEYVEETANVESRAGHWTGRDILRNQFMSLEIGVGNLWPSFLQLKVYRLAESVT